MDMGSRLHSVSMFNGMTKAYADMLRVHAKGLRQLHVSGIRGEFEWVTRVLSGAGELEFLSIEANSYNDVGRAGPINNVSRIKQVYIVLHSTVDSEGFLPKLGDAVKAVDGVTLDIAVDIRRDPSQSITQIPE